MISVRELFIGSREPEPVYLAMCKEKIRKENVQMCLSLSFQKFKILFKDRISSPL